MQLNLITVFGLAALATARPADVTTSSPDAAADPLPTLPPAGGAADNSTLPAGDVNGQNSTGLFTPPPPRDEKSCKTTDAEEVVKKWHTDQIGMEIVTILGNLNGTTIAENPTWYFAEPSLSTTGVICTGRGDGLDDDDDDDGPDARAAKNGDDGDEKKKKDDDKKKDDKKAQCDFATLGKVDFVSGQQELGAMGVQMFWRACQE